MPEEWSEQVSKKVSVIKNNNRKSKIISKDALLSEKLPYFYYSKNSNNNWNKLTAEEGEEYCSLRRSPCTWYYLQQCCQEPRLPEKELFINDRLCSIILSEKMSKQPQ